MHFGLRDDERFHQKASVAQVMEAQRRQMCEAIGRLPEAQLNAKPIEEIARAIAEKFSINMPVLDEAAIRPDRKEVDIDFSRDPTRLACHYGQRAVEKGTEITISVPFQGDPDVFRLHASNHTMDYPPGRITASTIVFRTQGTNLDPTQVRRDFDEWLAAIKRHLAEMTRELGAFNDSLLSEAMAALGARAGKLERDDELLAGLGFGPAVS